MNYIEKYGTAQAQYKALEPRRSSLEGTWRDCSALTLPYIFPDETLSESNTLPSPYNSLGPSGVNNLASKLLLSLLPPTGNFFRLLPFEEDTRDLDAEILKQIDSELSKTEQELLAMIDRQALRVPLYEAMKYLIITGNTLLYKVKGGGMKVFSPYQYVVERDYIGNVLKIIIKEKIALTALPESVQELYTKEETKASKDDKEQVDIYTCILLDSKNKFITYQETADTIIEGTEQTFNKDLLPYIPLRWTSLNNEYYGRGLVEQYLGDLRSLEGLSQMMLEGTSVMAKTIFGLKPASTVQLEDVAAARNGDIIEGDLEKDITVLRVDKGADFNIPFQLIQNLEHRLGRAFLFLGGAVRDSERTTATEVRAVAAELEAALGGAYSVLATELQLPLIKLLLQELNPTYTKITEPSITTGVSAISRERDFSNLNTMLQSMAALGPEVIAQYLDVEGYLRSLSTALGFNADAMVKTAEKREQEQAAMAQQQQMQQPMPPQGVM